ncbi:hypothetical protein [Pseudomonas sp.]|uniref:hypothetical protein n=1 Tax=Pseudomonas sp. TaxID=306 RepID=UPI003D0F4E32
MSVKVNLLANYVGQFWVAAAAFLFIPLYIKFLGVEAYGVIGFFAVLQAGMSILDAGVAPALNREIALYSVGRSTGAPRLIRSFEILGFLFFLFFASLLYLLSDWVSGGWLRSASISDDQINFSIVIMGGVVFLRFFEALYKSVLVGFQRQVLLNFFNVLFSTIRNGGAAVVLMFDGASLERFFVWQLFTSFGAVLVCSIVVYKLLPMREIGFFVDFDCLANVKKFALGAMSAAVLAFCLGQMDKILLSYNLTLIEFSHYALSATVAGVLSLLVGPVSQAIYPHLVSIDLFSSRVFYYRQAVRVVSLVLTPVATAFVFFPKIIIYGWSGSYELSEAVSVYLPLLAAGNLFSGIMVLPFMLEYVSGRVSLVLKANFFAVVFFCFFLLLVVPVWGGIGAALGWFFLNFSYFIFMGWLLHKDFALKDRLGWYFVDVLLPGAISAAIFFLGGLFFGVDAEGRWLGLFTVFIFWFFSVLVVAVTMYFTGGVFFVTKRRKFS